MAFLEVPFITFTDNGTTTMVNIDANSNGSRDIRIELGGVTGTDLNTMINDGNIVLF